MTVTLKHGYNRILAAFRRGNKHRHDAKDDPQQQAQQKQLQTQQRCQPANQSPNKAAANVIAPACSALPAAAVTSATQPATRADEASVRVPVFDEPLAGPQIPPSVLSKWEKTRLEARLARQPDGHVLVTSFTSSQPMHGWTLQHTIRELWQNLRDGLTSTFGHEGNLTVTPCGSHLVTVLFKGLEVGSVDMSQSGKLVFRQKYMVLQPKHLQLATFKTDKRYAGGHGEGFKVAINFLLKQPGYKVKYLMDGQTWEFEHQPHFDQTIKNMVVKMTHSSKRDDMEIIVSGPKAHTLFERQMDWDLTWTTKAAEGLLEKGSVTLSNNQQLVVLAHPWLPNAGCVYNRKLFVSKSEELKELALAVNLDMGLHRDRHVLPADLDSQVALALSQARTQFDPTSPVIQMLRKHLLDRFRRGPVKRLERLAAALRPELRSYCALQHGVPVDAIVFLPGKDVQELEAIGLVPIPNSGVLADNVDLKAKMLQYVRGINGYTPTNEAELAQLKWLRKLTEALRLNLQLTQAVVVQVKDLPHTPYVDMDFTGGTWLYLASFFLKSEEGWRSAAAQIFFILMHKFHTRAHSAHGSILVEFLMNPHDFTPKVVAVSGTNSCNGFSAGKNGDPSSTPQTQGAAGNGWGPESNCSGCADGSHAPAGHLSADCPGTGWPCGWGSSWGHVEGGTTGKAGNVPFSDVKFRSAAPTVHQVYSAGVEYHLPGIKQNGFRDVSATCGLPEATLFDWKVKLPSSGQIISVYVDTTVFECPEFEAARDRFCARLPDFHHWLQDLLQQLQAALKLKIYLYYVVCHRARGFTYKGGVYLNLWPITGIGNKCSLQEARESMLLTIVHEVAHWNHPLHDQNFAEEQAKLMWACRNICLGDEAGEQL